MSFRRGQKVVCVVDAGTWAADVQTLLRVVGAAPPLPDKGAVYTIVGAQDRRGGCFLELAELPAREPFGPIWYRADAFRPAVDPEISIDVFHAILDEVNRRKFAPAPERELEVVESGAAPHPADGAGRLLPACGEKGK